MIFTRIASIYAITLFSLSCKGSIASVDDVSCTKISGGNSNPIILKPTSGNPFSLNESFESPSLPFQTADYKVTNIVVDSECTSNGVQAAPTCDWTVSLSFCDIGGACDASDKSFRSGTFKAFGTGPTAYFIPGSGTGSFDGVTGSIDSELNLQTFNLENVQINLCSKNIQYGDIIFLQNNKRDNKWLTGARNSSNKFVFTTDFYAPSVIVSGKPDDYESTTVAKSYEWIIRSTPGDGKRETIDPNQGSCVKYGDRVHFQNNYKESRWLTGGRTNGNDRVYTADKFAPSIITDDKPDDYEQTTVSATYEWVIRSIPGDGTQGYVDTRAGRCLEAGDIIYPHVGRKTNRWLNGSRGDGKQARTWNTFGESFLSNKDSTYERIDAGRNYQWIVSKEIGDGTRP